MCKLISLSIVLSTLISVSHAAPLIGPISIEFSHFCFNLSLPHPLVFPQDCYDAISAAKQVPVPPYSNPQIRSIIRSHKSCTVGALLPPSTNLSASTFDDLADDCVYPVGFYGGSVNLNPEPDISVPGLFILQDNRMPGYMIYPTFWSSGVNESSYNRTSAASNDNSGAEDSPTSNNNSGAADSPSTGPPFNYTAGFYGP